MGNDYRDLEELGEPRWWMNAYIFGYETEEDVMWSAVGLMNYWAVATTLVAEGVPAEDAWHIDELVEMCEE